MEDVYQFIEGCGALLLLADASACLFERVGDPAIEAEAQALGFRPGAFLDESRIGTNAFSLALAEGAPIQVLGPEHYLHCFHGLHSAAAPLHGPGGSPIGIIGLLQRQPEFPAQSLGAVFAAARAIESQLQAEHFIREANAQATEFNATLDAVSEGILAWTTQGIVTHLNGQGGRLLGIKPSLAVGRPLADHIVLAETISRAAARGEELNDVEAGFKAGGEKHVLSASLRVIRGRGGEPEAFIATLRPMAQVHRLVNRLLGTQARLTLTDIVGRSAAVQQMRRASLAAVDSSGCVLLVGEQGAGQNALARAIHNSGARAEGPFLAINCRAIPRELALEELLGFEPGAFGNAAGQPSKFELADGGTLYLEDVAAMPLEMQSILVRILGTGQVARLGGKRAVAVDVRFLASAEDGLEQRMLAGSFRADLFRLLDRHTIRIPPLRERAEDIQMLVDRSLESLRAQFGRSLAVSAPALDLLRRYPWPGNIDELGSVMELSAFNAEGGTIAAEHLPDPVRDPAALRANPPLPAPVQTIKELEKVAIANALLATRGNHSRAARSLSISRNTLYRKMKELDIANPQRHRSED
jgi:transcriptional activator for dhaKLM operon